VTNSLIFRSWFYFRQGWSTYFAFIFAAINTLTVTYYLAIEKYPLLHTLFPTFWLYVAVVAGIGIPVLVLAGYVHFKRSNAFKAEADINVEANPHFRRLLSNTEILFPILLKLLELTTKINNENLSEEETKELNILKDNLNDYMKKNTI